MKPLYVFAFLTMVGGTTLNAQNSHNAALLMDNQLNGTARFIGMGGAMSALGADISTMSTNPAGIGLYRSSDVALTMGWFNPTSKSEFSGETHKDKVSRFSFDQVGFVYSTKLGNRTTIRYINFGFNYRKSNNLYSHFTMGGVPQGDISLTQNMVGSLQAAGIQPSDFSSMLNDENCYFDNRYGWLNIMGGLTGAIGVETGQDEAGNPYEGYYSWHSERNRFHSENRGGIYAYDFNVAMNVLDRVYLGLTIGVYDVDYSRYSSYTEYLYDPMGVYQPIDMCLENHYKLKGSGVDAKLGIIVRPFEYSPLRIGLAVHTPTWYNLSEIASARMSTYDMDGSGWETTTDGLSNWYDYNFRTPWKFNLSAGYTFGQNIAIDAEYEYADYSASEFSDTQGYEMGYANSAISEDLKGVSSFRIGMEARLMDNLSLRLGYNYAGAMFNKNAYKAYVQESINTDVDFMNSFDANNLSIGLGFRWGGFYADAAYVYTHQKADFHPYSNYIFDEPDLISKVTNVTNRAVLTLGYRF